MYFYSAKLAYFCLLILIFNMVENEFYYVSLTSKNATQTQKKRFVKFMKKSFGMMKRGFQTFALAISHGKIH